MIGHALSTLQMAMRFGGVSPRHQFVSRSAHPGSKPDKAAKAKAHKAKQKRHCKRCPEMRGQRQKARR
jgi:hypothetical protein